MPVNYKRLVDLYETKGVDDANEVFREALVAKEVKANEIDFGRLFEQCYGWSNFLAGRRKEKLANEIMEENLTESEGGVSTANFLNIIGQIVYSLVLDAYNDVENIFTKLIPEVPTAFLFGEKAAGITEIGDELAIRNEGDPYRLAGVGEDWIFLPAVKDRGMIVPVTWEAIFADRTGLVQSRCANVGKWGGINREKRAIDCAIDENTTAHRYNWRGTIIATYGDNSGSHTWDNLSATNGLVDWTNVNTIEQLFNGLLDPYTGEVIDIEPKHLIVTKQLEQTARRIMRQGEIRVTSPGYATSANPSQHVGDNPYANKYEVVTSKRLAPRLATDTDWFIGDLGKACRYMVAEPANVVQAPPNSEAEFSRRIVSQFRFSERGAYATVQPRALCKGTVA